MKINDISINDHIQMNDKRMLNLLYVDGLIKQPPLPQQPPKRKTSNIIDKLFEKYKNKKKENDINKPLIQSNNIEKSKLSYKFKNFFKGIKISSSKKDIKSINKCVICLENKREYIIIPCGHLCILLIIIK